MAFLRWSRQHFVVDVIVVFVVVVVVFSAYKNPKGVIKKPPEIVLKQRCVYETSQQ